MFRQYFYGFFNLSTKDIAILAGCASLAGAITSIIVTNVSPWLGHNWSVLVGGFIGCLIGNALLHRLRRKDGDD